MGFHEGRNEVALAQMLLDYLLTASKRLFIALVLGLENIRLRGCQPSDLSFTILYGGICMVRGKFKATTFLILLIILNKAEMEGIL